LELPFDPAELPAYEFLAFIDRGAMGAVYRARQKALDRPVAIKLLDVRIEADSARQRFLQEARLAARLLHPNIVAVFDAGEAAGMPYIVFELVEGESLARRLDRLGRLPLKEALGLGRGIAEGLAAAHEAGILHRDLKPQNILVNRAGVPKIADFGISKSLTGDGVKTRVNVILGTPSYMSPEQIRGEELTIASDVYALGVVLYELLAGRPPFAGSMDDILKSHLQVEPPSLMAEAAVPEPLARLVSRALEKEPGARWGTAAEMALALTKAWALVETGASQASRPTRPKGMPTVAGEVPAPRSGTGAATQPSLKVQPRVPAVAAPTAAVAPDFRALAVLGLAVVLVVGGLAWGLKRPAPLAAPSAQSGGAEETPAPADGPPAQAPPAEESPAPASPHDAPVPAVPAGESPGRSDAWSQRQLPVERWNDRLPDTPIRGNLRSLVYHKRGSEFYDAIAPRNRIGFQSEEEARAAGYRPPRELGPGRAGRRRGGRPAAGNAEEEF
jgi:serine/threonine-protein kinase